jgi:hypothetical protein
MTDTLAKVVSTPMEIFLYPIHAKPMLLAAPIIIPDSLLARVGPTVERLDVAA